MQAVLLGLMALVVSIALFVAALAWAPWWNYPRQADGTVDPAGRLNTRLTFAQVFTGFAAVFIAGTLGWLAIQEFRQAQAQPELELNFHSTDNKNLSLHIEAPDKLKEDFITIALYNTGSVVAVWYMVEIHLPFLTEWPSFSQRASNRDPREFVETVVGAWPANWEWSVDPNTRVLLLTFLSQGQVGAYPKFPLVLCQITLPRGAWAGGYESTCRYSIGLEREEPQHGTLRIVVEDSHGP